jgi:uncharacterized membrane protein
MPTAEISITVDRPVNEVFDYAVEIDRLPEWNLVIQDAWPTSPDQKAIGATYMVKAKIAGKVMEIPSVVVAYESNRLYAYEAKGSMPYISTKIFERTKTGTRVTERLEMRHKRGFARLLEPVLLRISRRSHQKNLGLLKTKLEGTEAVVLA